MEKFGVSLSVKQCRNFGVSASACLKWLLDSGMVAAVAASIFVLRRRARGATPGETAAVFRMPGYPWLPAVFVACLTGLAAQIALTQTRLALAGTAVLLAGLPLYHLMRRASGAGRPA